MCERLIGDLKRSKDIDEAAEDKVLSWFFVFFIYLQSRISVSFAYLVMNLKETIKYHRS